MTHRFDVIIIGAGVVGLTAASAMLARGYSVALIDANTILANLPETSPRVYAVNQASQELFSQLGAWQFMDKQRLSPYQHMHVWDAASGAYIDFNSRMIAANNLGHIIEESVLKYALMQTLSTKQDLTLFAHHHVKRIVPGASQIEVSSDKATWLGKLLLVADGANSTCRQLLNVPLISWPYHQHALVASVITELPHQQTAYQVFNADGPLAFLPLNNPHQCSIVWSTRPNQVKKLITCAEHEFNQALQKAFANRLGKLSLYTPRYQFPLFMRQAKHYAGAGWILLGDAAHTIHPLAGLGLNVGLADVAAWLKQLDHGLALGESRQLNAYQRERKHAVWQVIALMEGLKALFLNPLTPFIGLRGLGLRVCNQLTPFKRLLIEQATGRPVNHY